jgi:hypothetical protein
LIVRPSFAQRPRAWTVRSAAALVRQLDRGGGEAARQGLVVVRERREGPARHHGGGTQAGTREPPEGDGGEHV